VTVYDDAAHSQQLFPTKLLIQNKIKNKEKKK